MLQLRSLYKCLAESATMQEVPLSLHEAVFPRWGHAMRHHQGQGGVRVQTHVVTLNLGTQGGGDTLLEGLGEVS